MPTKPSILLPSAGRLVDSAMAPSPAHLYFLVRPRSKAWLPMVTPSLPKKMPKKPSKLPVILERNGVMSAVPRPSAAHALVRCDDELGAAIDDAPGEAV